MHVVRGAVDELIRIALCRVELTQENLDGALAHVVVTVEGLSVEGAHLLAHVPAVVVEQLDEALQHVEVESRRDQFPMRPPFVT